MAALNEHNLYIVYPILIISGLGIGGIVVPASIISTIICPDELIATVAALTLAIRVLGGAIGYAVYYNVFVNKFKTGNHPTLQQKPKNQTQAPTPTNTPHRSRRHNRKSLLRNRRHKPKNHRRGHRPNRRLPPR